jgi:peptide/nickel transport system permease protein
MGDRSREPNADADAAADAAADADDRDRDRDRDRDPSADEGRPTRVRPPTPDGGTTSSTSSASSARGADAETFEDVDWAGVDAGRALLSRRDLGAAVTLAAVAVAFAYDALVLPTGEPLVPGPVPWDLSQLDWLFVVSIVAFGWYVVVPLAENRRLTRHYWRQFRRNRLAVASLAYLLVVFGIGALGPILLQKPEIALARQYQPPAFLGVDSSVPIRCVGPTVDGVCRGTLAHPFGTTADGKDVLVMVIYGMNVSLRIGLIVPLIVITIGTTVGTVAAYAGGWVDEVLMRYVDIQQTFPAFFLFLILTYVLGGSLFLFVVIFGFFGWESIARLVRSEALQRREEGYVRAAAGAGAGTAYVVRRHLVPNVSSTVITATTLLVPSFILFEAALSFLGLGDPTVPSWGRVIAGGRSDLDSAWWISTFPGIFLFFTILAFNFVGDALRDALDPRSSAGGDGGGGGGGDGGGGDAP